MTIKGAEMRPFSLSQLKPQTLQILATWIVYFLTTSLINKWFTSYIIIVHRSDKVRECLQMMSNFAPDTMPNNNLQGAYQANTDHLANTNKRIILAERDSQEIFALSHCGNSEIIIGRTDRLANYTPTLDLAFFGGYRLGVSRLHISIIIEEESVTVIDLNSCNGTSLNNIPLEALKPYPLKTGDELQLGSLILEVVSA